MASALPDVHNEKIRGLNGLKRIAAAGRRRYGKSTMTKAPIPFRGFDEGGEVRIYDHGILPHWRQTGCTYFVTFRLADSIPKAIVRRIEYERNLWLKARGIDAQNHDWKRDLASLSSQEQHHFQSLVRGALNKSLDECHGCCALRDPAIATIVSEALDYFHGLRVLTGDFVVMPNHVHALLTPVSDHKLEDVLQSVKSYTAHKINGILHRTGPFWQKESYDHIVRDIEQLDAFQRYIASNPTKAFLAEGEFIHLHAVYSRTP